LAGFHEHAVNFYAAADMGIMLTKFRSESFPLTIIESLFAGRPFIATDVGEIRSMLSTAGGLAGEVIPMDNWQVPVDLAADAIARHVLRPELVRTASERAVEASAKYRIDRVVAAYVKLFERDVEASSRRQTSLTSPMPAGASWVAGVEARCGTTIDAIADQYCSQRPGWVTGDIGRQDARFLMHEVLESRATSILEIGTASGMSTGLLCLAIESARQAGLIGSEYRVYSYDIVTKFYADTRYCIGDAARELLDDTMLSHITFRNPATALDAAREHAADSVRFLFIDASHKHPWPALDLLATLPILAPGATVVLHDVNLPLVCPQYPSWGAHHLFNGLSLEKRLAAEGYGPHALPNVGSVVIPKDMDRLRAEIHRIIATHPWEDKIPHAVLAELDVRHP
jgi:predicted O-methyltransferase YrrM